jgi:hypothetical protein
LMASKPSMIGMLMSRIMMSKWFLGFEATI